MKVKTIGPGVGAKPCAALIGHVNNGTPRDYPEKCDLPAQLCLQIEKMAAETWVFHSLSRR